MTKEQIIEYWKTQKETNPEIKKLFNIKLSHTYLYSTSYAKDIGEVLDTSAVSFEARMCSIIMKMLGYNGTGDMDTINKQAANIMMVYITVQKIMDMIADKRFKLKSDDLNVLGAYAETSFVATSVNAETITVGMLAFHHASSAEYPVYFAVFVPACDARPIPIAERQIKCRVLTSFQRGWQDTEFIHKVKDLNMDTMQQEIDYRYKHRQ